jgi:hypothetical protein
VARWFVSAAQVVVLTATVCAVAAGAQSPRRSVTANTADATRAELTQRLDSLVRADGGNDKASVKRARTSEIQALRTRLADGDFRAGDRFLIDYGNPAQRPDTVIVRDSSNIALLNWPATSIHGVLRSELQGAVEKYVQSFVREPRLRVYSLTRIQFVGGFGKPGVYDVDPTRPLSDAIMSAGGTAGSAKPDQVTIRRDGNEIMNVKRVSQALADGATVQDLGLESGDELRVPRPKQINGFRGGRIQTILFSVSIVTALIAFIRSSYAQ